MKIQPHNKVDLLPTEEDEIREQISILQLAHEKQLKPYFDRLVAIHSISVRPMYMAMSEAITNGMSMLDSDGKVLTCKDFGISQVATEAYKAEQEQRNRQARGALLTATAVQNLNTQTIPAPNAGEGTPQLIDAMMQLIEKYDK